MHMRTREPIQPTTAAKLAFIALLTVGLAACVDPVPIGMLTDTGSSAGLSSMSDDSISSTSASDSDASTSTSTSTSTSEGTTTLGTTTADSEATTTLDTEGLTTIETEGTTSGTTTAGLECDPVGLQACAVDSCVQRWNYACDECDIEFDPARCFGVDIGCAYPALTCNLPKPCERIWAFGERNPETLEFLESDDAALCVLTSLRDGEAARHEILWGAMEDSGVVVMDVFADGAGGATIQWEVDCQGCPSSGSVGRSGLLALQPAGYFDDCLDAPTTASLIQCAFGFTDFSQGSGPADGYTPPWTTGECTALEFACPG